MTHSLGLSLFCFAAFTGRTHKLDRNTHRIPDYFRLDLALNIDPGHYLKQFTHMSFTIGVYNVTARKNAYSVFFNGAQSYLLSVFAYPIPYINLNLKF